MDLHKHSIDDVEWNGSGDHVEIVLVRHGETDWNAERILQGHQQTSLNKKGKEQIIELAKNLKGEKFDALVVSDLKRATESAEILSKELDIKIDLELPELRERAMGEYEGKKAIDIIPKDKMPKKGQSIALLIKDIIGKKGGETWDQFLDRARKAADMLHKNYKGKRVLVVAHGGILRTFETLYGNGKYKESANAATTTFKIAPSFKRIPEVFDCWVESGSMPYAQPHFPFAPLTSDVLCPTSEVPPGFPADFIAEGIDQTRGWFYTLTVLSTALFGQSPFKNCIVNGTVLAEDGKKMSKRLKNYPDPSLLIDKYGADAFRFALINAPVVRGEDLRFSEKLVAETMRNIMLKLWNSYSFFVTYANASEFEPTDTRKDSKHPLDIWIKAEMQDLANRITEQLDKYEISYACAELDDTIDALTNWYIRLSRKRFAGQDKEALDTLYDVLLSLSQLIAPFCPFMADAIYLNLVPEEHGSVHLTDWPEARSLKKSEKELIERTRVMRLIVSLGHKVRAEKNIKVRQPLSKAVIAIPPAIPKLSKENLALLRQELNVKDLSFADDPKELADVIVKVDARKVGPRLGERVQEIIQAGKNGDFKIEDDGSILIRDEKLTPEEAEVVYLGKEGLDAAAEKGVVVSVNTEVTDNLKSEGLARDLIRTVQRLRKERGLTFTDKIHLKIEGADDVLKSHGKLIEEETRSTFKDNKGKAQKVDLDGKKVTISFSKTST